MNWSVRNPNKSEGALPTIAVEILSVFEVLDTASYHLSTSRTSQCELHLHFLILLSFSLNSEHR